MIDMPDDDAEKPQVPTTPKDTTDPKKVNSPLPPVDLDLIVELPQAPAPSEPEGE